MEEEFFTPAEVAEKFKVTKQAVYKWMKEGKLDYEVVGSDRRITATAIAAFLRAGKEAEAQKRLTPSLAA